MHVCHRGCMHGWIHIIKFILFETCSFHLLLVSIAYLSFAVILLTFLTLDVCSCVLVYFLLLLHLAGCHGVSAGNHGGMNCISVCLCICVCVCLLLCACMYVLAVLVAACH